MKQFITIAIALGLVACGGGDNAEQQAQEQANALGNQLGAALQQAAAQGQQQAAAAQANAQQAAAAAGAQAQAAAAAAGGSNFGTVSLTPGFMPDPHTASGTSGGATDASTVNPACAGWIDSTPDHLFVAGGTFGNLRIMAHSTADITLVVQKPDGSYLCNDDTEGTDPVVAGPMAQGTYKIWIGSYQQGTNSPYTLGITELGSVNPSSLAGS